MSYSHRPTDTVPVPAANHSAVKGVPALELRGLRKRYGVTEAVSDLSFEVRSGEVFGLLGPNGAGKTTTISVISTHLKPTEGDAFVFGHSVRNDVRAVRKIIGVVPQEISLYPHLSAIENLKFFGRMYKVEPAAMMHRISQLLKLVGLESRSRDQVAEYSGGMKRRLNLAVSLIHDPKLILLDEPTVGVDPHSRENIFDIVHRLKSTGAAILYTTHYMEEAERLCDRLAIMDEGRIIAMGALAELLTEAGCSEVIELRGLPRDADLENLRNTAGVCRIEQQEVVTRVFVNRAVRVLGPLGEALRRYGDSVAMEIAPLSLENLFLQLTGKELRD